MNSIYDYIIKPIGERYNNSKKVGNKNLILNTKIETFKAVNKKAKIRTKNRDIIKLMVGKREKKKK